MSDSALPQTHSALVVVEHGKADVRDRPLPKLKPDTVLVRVHGVALNPTDWLHVDVLLNPGSSVGSDFAGIVKWVGPEAEGKGLRVGDAVAGFTRGGKCTADNAAFQEYVLQKPELLWHKPASLNFEDAAGMGGIALSTAAMAVFHRLGFDAPWLAAKQATHKDTPLLVWAGSTAVGIFVVQLGKLAGLRVATTASKRNQDLVKSFGADFVVDHNDADASQQLKAWAEPFGGFRHAVDCYSNYGSTRKTSFAMAQGGGEIIRILADPEKTELADLAAGVKTTHILVYTSLTKTPVTDVLEDFKYWQSVHVTADQTDFEFIVQWNVHLPELINNGSVKPLPRKHIDGGLTAIPQGLDYLRSGKASAEKVTFTIA
ncbi:GroES-like protein [Auriculariales sp. MPI-PUGE-AT-0066]|nr:GroES-like protein [Auriculariales sp. MPI-PUGE-AT-0066]